MGFEGLFLTCEEVRAIDVRAGRDYGIPGLVLMENAGRDCAELLMRLGVRGRVIVVAGKGNNGGDGAVMVRHLRNRGVDADLLLCCVPEELAGDAAVNYGVLRAAGWEGFVWERDVSEGFLANFLSKAEWIVDALLGTGAQGSAREPYASVIRGVNESGKRVLAIDVPSGMDCDRGVAEGVCIRAEATATFVAEKAGFRNPSSAEYTGTVHVIDIGIPRVMLDPSFVPRRVSG